MPNDDCYYLRGAKSLNGISLMVIGGTVARVEVDTMAVASVSGAHVGTTEKQLKALYGPRLKVEPHKYLEEKGHYLTLRSTDGRRGIRFETENGRVFRFYAGPWTHLRYVEGCM